MATWAIKENVKLSALKTLLPIIREIPGCSNIPKDPRTLVKTPSKIIVTPLGHGTYKH